jgi:hypothetical protein
MYTNGLKLSLFALATSGAGGVFEPAAEPWWMRLGVAGMAIIALVYVYNDTRKSASAHAAELKTIMTEHKNDMSSLMAENKKDMKDLLSRTEMSAVHMAEVAATVTATSNALMCENNTILREVKTVVQANTSAVAWCRDQALSRGKGS